MCYSNSSTSSNVTLGKIYQREIITLPHTEPTYYANGFSFPIWRIVTRDPSIKLMQWGLIPSWFNGLNPAEIASKTLNARVETLSEKASFNRLLSSQRCIVPSSGFFEFQHHGAVKKPYFIYPKTSEIFSMAGLFDEWINRDTGEILGSFTIITTPANPLMEEIHNHKKRMPLILDPQEVQSYLLSEKNIKEYKRHADDDMAAHVVDKQLIFSRTPNIPSVQHPIVDNIGQQTLLF